MCQEGQGHGDLSCYHLVVSLSVLWLWLLAVWDVIEVVYYGLLSTKKKFIIFIIKYNYISFIYFVIELIN